MVKFMEDFLGAQGISFFSEFARRAPRSSGGEHFYFDHRWQLAREPSAFWVMEVLELSSRSGSKVSRFSPVVATSQRFVSFYCREIPDSL